jgi:alanyl-tRNA synthetase
MVMMKKDGTTSNRSLSRYFFYLGGFMKKMTGSQIRQMWLDFFAFKGHQIIPGKSLIPYQDPTLLWINSGVAAIKPYFDGREIPTHKRLTNAQKSIRTNDIDQVGYTARHHTFFEMLGNFSIGDYFRKEAITWAYELLTSPQWFGFALEKLYMTYSPLDQETYKLWLSLGVASDHLIPLEGNFWEIGEGPCGPDTEIFYDRGETFDPNHQGVNLLKQEISNDRYIEIWNIVFSQYNAVSGVLREKYQELPSKNIDTGAGLERLASIFQGTPTNFETDLFFPIIQAIEPLASVNYSQSEYRPYRVIADHIRTLTFALADGAIFANEGRGYVLRRLLRRALRYGRKIGIQKPFLFSLVSVVRQIMEKDYPYLSSQEANISKMIFHEEEKFLKTLHHGESLLKTYLDKKQSIDGEVAFKLYDTYGFPVELTQEIASESQLSVDMAGFHVQMEAQRDRARQARQQLGSMAKQSADLLAFKQTSPFIEVDKVIRAKVIGLFQNGVKVDSITDEGEVILDQTNFYAESGGQTSDIGTWLNEQTKATVLDVQKAPHGQALHKITIQYGRVSLGDSFELQLDIPRRRAIRQHHSSLHLLQAALKQHLGPHILQQGSFVGDQYARFDFSHSEKINEQTLALIEQDVNDQIQAGYPSQIEVLPLDEARKTGATAPFDEKYGDMVRIVTLGPRSKEFCGGTHVQNTQDIGIFAIMSEESIAAGTRRMVVATGSHAYAFFKQKETLLRQLRHQLGATSTKELTDRIKVLKQESLALSSALQQAQDGQAEAIVESLKTQFVTTPFLHLFNYFPALNRALLTKVMDRLKIIQPESVILLIGQEAEVYPLAAYVGPSLRTSTRQAGTLVKLVAGALKGSGGGKPDLAFGAGKIMTDLQPIWQQIKR